MSLRSNIFLNDGDDVVAEYVDEDDDGDVDRKRVYWLLKDIDQLMEWARGAVKLTADYTLEHKEMVVPFVEPGVVTLKHAEMLVSLGLSHSKRSYMTPLPVLEH